MLEKKCKPLALNQIQVKDSFWKEYMELVREHVIPYQWEALNDRIEGAEPSHCINNFKVAAGLEKGSFQGMIFQDSDVYKWLEAVAYSLMWHPDEALEKTADDVIALIGKAQQEDGYLDTYYIINGLDKRFTNLMDNHELYCLGHMVEAAASYYRSTGKRAFLEIAIRFVDCVEKDIGIEEGKTHGYPGHEVAEMALMQLFEITQSPTHLKLAKYFVDQRGQTPLYFDEECRNNGNVCRWDDSSFQKQYYQAGIPVRQQEKAEGHAVRAVYLYSGMADVASVTGDKELFAACGRLWKNMTEKRMYITGGIGSSEYGEAFTFDYDLPNDTVYAETCASIGLIFFARRMFEITKDSCYTDVMEQALYNGVISGMSLDGKKFFYVNPLEVVPEASEKDYNKKHVKVERQKWFGCACCPPNLARLISSIGGYAYEQSEDTLFMNLFIGGEVEAKIGGIVNNIHIKTSYPWRGGVEAVVKNSEDAEFALAVRIPGWCKTYSLQVNGSRQEQPVEKGYVYIKRRWKNGDQILFDMEMPVQMIEAAPWVRENVGKVALMRGPIVYCLEEVDNGSKLQELSLSETPDFTCDFEESLLKGVITIQAKGRRLREEDWGEGELYRTYRGRSYKEQNLKLIPYFAWTNRKPGEMAVWVRT